MSLRWNVSGYTEYVYVVRFLVMNITGNDEITFYSLSRGGEGGGLQGGEVAEKDETLQWENIKNFFLLQIIYGRRILFSYMYVCNRRDNVIIFPILCVKNNNKKKKEIYSNYNSVQVRTAVSFLRVRTMPYIHVCFVSERYVYDSPCLKYLQ